MASSPKHLFQRVGAGVAFTYTIQAVQHEASALQDGASWVPMAGMPIASCACMQAFHL